jgi:hypothetical protein
MNPIFEQIQLPIQLPIFNYSLEIQEKIAEYLKQLSPSEKQTYIIAHEHLGTSFNVLKSNGFKDYLKKAPHVK